jgi:hypothetical protein
MYSIFFFLIKQYEPRRKEFINKATNDLRRGAECVKSIFES